MNEVVHHTITQRESERMLRDALVAYAAAHQPCLREAALFARDVLAAQIRNAAAGASEDERSRKLQYDAWRKLDRALARGNEDE